MSTSKLPTRLNLSFDVELALAGSLPVTWGQQAIWDAMRDLGKHDHQFNLHWVLTLPTPRPACQVLTALAWLVDRHESLRSVFGDGHDGTATQRLLERCEIPLEWRAGGGGAGDTGRAAGLAEELCARRFQHHEEPPLRVGLLHVGGDVTHVVLAVSHMTADNDGLVRAAGELLDRIQGRDSRSPEPTQPREIAALQMSEPWQARSGRAIEYWRNILRAAPPMETPPDIADERSPRFWRGSLRSCALPGAVGELAQAGGVSTTSVLLAAASSVLGTLTGSSRPCLMLMCNNRTREPFRSAISPVALEGIVSFDVSSISYRDGSDAMGAGGDFGAVVRRAWNASLLAYRYAQYDKTALLRGIAQAGGTRSSMHRTCWFNDLRFDRRPQLPREDAGDPERGEFSWRGFTHEQGDADLAFHIYDHEDALQVTLTADTRVVGPRTIERALHTMERMITDAAVAARAVEGVHD
ncbi:condensation domain-containing protein [Streptomyces sp. NPDC088260]|uniref:condensation domain-containing protein n=1 Tax=Streptomyces sp. NPDC088260 TaxID=3365850 RepID=UPI0038022941